MNKNNENQPKNSGRGRHQTQKGNLAALCFRVMIIDFNIEESL
jgi:hypothetical protein